MDFGFEGTVHWAVTGWLDLLMDHSLGAKRRIRGITVSLE